MSALHLAQSQHRALTALIEPVLARLLGDQQHGAALLDYARRQGLANGPDGQRTLARQAALLGLLGCLHAQRGGHDAEALLRERGLAAAWSADNEAQTTFAVSPLDAVVRATDARAELDLSKLAELMAAHPYTDAIGALYEQAVPQAERRQLGQFWTPQPIAEFLAAWAITRAEDTVLDPASGSGALLLAAMARLRALGATPQQLPDRLAANDIDGLVRALAVCTLSAYHPGPWPQLRLADALCDRRGQRFDAIVANPPYTRHHHLPAAYKAQLRAQLKEDLGLHTSGFASLFAYFFLHCLTLLAPTGRMAFITPAELFDASYAQAIQAHVLDHVNLRAVLVFGDDFAAFPGVDTAGAINLVEGGSSDGAPVRFVELDAWPGQSELLATLTDGEDGPRSWGLVRTVERSQLAQTRKWTVAQRHRRTKRAGTVALSELARPMRGIATGNNAFFTLTDVEVAQTGIEARYLRAMVAKTRDVLSTSLTASDHERLRAADKKAWLLECRENPEQFSDALAAYIREGERQGVPAGKLVSLRSRWWEVERRQPPALLFTYLSRGWPRFIANELAALNLNGFHSLYPHDEITADPTLLAALTAILNSSVVLDGLPALGRSYGGGTIKVEPRELDGLAVYDPRQLKPRLVTQLAELHAEGCRLHPQQFAAVRQRIDALLGL